VIYDLAHPIQGDCVMVDPADGTHRTTIPDRAECTDLLVPILRRGELVGDLPSIDDARNRAQEQLDAFHPRIKRFVNPHVYPVGLELGLHERKTEIILKERGIQR